MPVQNSKSNTIEPPENRKLTRLQAAHLASLTGADSDELEGLTVAQASEKLQWIADPTLFWFRKICGQVVAPDPVTGVEHPVPFATVDVQETECTLLGYFPPALPWVWHFPIRCERETIATVQTDVCGKFCVLVPRFELEWIRVWRLERICYNIIFNRPTIGDLLSNPVPGQPNPGPLATLTSLPPGTIGAIAGPGAQVLAQRVTRLQASQSLGAPNTLAASLLQRRAFDSEQPPPLPAEFRDALAGQGRLVAAQGADPVEGIRGAIAQTLGLDPVSSPLKDFDPDNFIGPFLRCFDVLLPEWQLLFEVPDITFLVTQDVDGSGVQQTIYDDPFGANWSVESTNNITLVANGIAKTTQTCQAPDVPCGDVPAILFAGLMPLDNPAYFNETASQATTGCALRPNRPANGDGSVTPVPTDLTRPPAQTPFCETVQLYGCVNVPVGDGTSVYYRVMQSLNGGPFSAITGVSWQIYTFPGGLPVTIAPDFNGWYQVLPDPDAYFPANLVLDWPTPSLGLYTLKLQVTDATKSVIIESAAVPIEVDNTVPAPNFTTLSWKFAGAPDSTLVSLLGLPCPLIKRGSTPQDIEVVFTVNVSGNHLRDTSIGVSGCGGGSFVLETVSPPYETYHWYTTPNDNNVTLSGRYTLSSTALDGCYSFGCTANSRAMNPSGADGGNLSPTDWYEDVVYIYADPSISVAVVSEN
jgi:hypothetical protein